MKIFISIFLLFILGFLTSKIKINVISLKDIRIEFYLFGILKIFKIKLKDIDKEKLKKANFKSLKLKVILDLLKKLDIKLEKLKLNLEIGTDDIMSTVFLVTLISTFLSIISAKNNKKYEYKIIPAYNQWKLNFEISSRISINMINIIKAFQFMNKNKFLEDTSSSKKQMEDFLRS